MKITGEMQRIEREQELKGKERLQVARYKQEKLKKRQGKENLRNKFMKV